MIEKKIGALTLTTPSDREIVMTREFDAPRELVFEAHSKPDHMRRWSGPRPARSSRDVARKAACRRRRGVRSDAA